jgi:mxaJ protein
MPFVFDMAMGVRRADVDLRFRLDSVIARRQPEIAAILDEYSVPRVGTIGGVPST